MSSNPAKSSTRYELSIPALRVQRWLRAADEPLTFERLGALLGRVSYRPASGNRSLFLTRHVLLWDRLSLKTARALRDLIRFRCVVLRRCQPSLYATRPALPLLPRRRTRQLTGPHWLPCVIEIRRTPRRRKRTHGKAGASS